MSQVKRKAILIVGMHRSGTSALTRVLNLLGVDLPRDLLPPSRGNELGHWEPAKAVPLHDAMLQSARSHWSSIFGIDPSWFESSAAQRHREALIDFIETEFGNAPLFAVKDPRMALLIPIWRQALQARAIEPYFILPFRSAFEVASSLQRRQNFFEPDSVWPIERGTLLWLRYVLTAERETRGSPRAFVPFDSLLNTWESEVRRLAQQLSLTWPRQDDDTARQIGDFLNRDHKHEVASEGPKAIYSGSPWPIRVLEQLEACVEAPQSGSSVFDAAWDALEDATHLFDGYVRELEAKTALASDPEGASSAAWRLWQERNLLIKQLEADVATMSRERDSYAERVRQLEGEAEDKWWAAAGPEKVAAELEQQKALVIASEANARAAEAMVAELQQISEATSAAFSRLGHELGQASKMLSQILRQLDHEQNDTSGMHHRTKHELDEAYSTVVQTLDQLEQELGLHRSQSTQNPA